MSRLIRIEFPDTEKWDQFEWYVSYHIAKNHITLKKEDLAIEFNLSALPPQVKQNAVSLGGKITED